MNRVHFEERVKAVPDDMNALHVETENSFGELIQALTGGVDTVLFENDPPTASHVGPNIVMNIPEQWFAVDGIFAKIAAAVASRPATPDWHGIYFVAYRTDVTGTRDRYTLAGGVVTVAPETVIIRKPSNCRIEIVSSGNPGTAPSPPTLGPNDIGYVKLADVVWTGSGTPTVTHNLADLYSFPGAGVAFVNHAIQHLPSGLDPIQTAAMGGDPLGSRPGLMPSGYFQYVYYALQDIAFAATSPFFSRSLNVSHNDPSASPPESLIAELDLKIDSSLASKEISGEYYLGLNFRTGPRAGQDDRPARYDHTHSPGDSPFGTDFARVAVPGDVGVGSILALPAFTAFAKIHNVQVFWLPPTSLSDPYPMIECNWIPVAGGTIGAKAHITSSNVITIELGSVALTEMSAAVEALAIAAIGGGSPTWTFAGYTNRPTSGYLMVRVIGER